MKKTELTKKINFFKKELKKAQLVAITKYSPVDDIVLAYKAGQHDFGENRVQDLIDKSATFQELQLNRVRWHFVGHLQTNKVRDLFKVPHLYAIHSVDSTRLLEEILKRESDLESELKLFFQVNTSHEGEKSGFLSSEELKLALSLLLEKHSSKLKLYGLMTMGTIRTEDFEGEASRCFRDLANIAKSMETSLGLKNKLMLSMGMSQDYKIALEHGADYIRIGSALFKD